MGKKKAEFIVLSQTALYCQKFGRHILGQKQPVQTSKDDDLRNGNSIELVQTLRMKNKTNQNAESGSGNGYPGDDVKSFGDPIPERYVTENDFI